MAKRLNVVNFVYTAIGIGIVAGVGYYVYRNVRNRRLEGAWEQDATATASTGNENLMDLRRSTRKAGRAVKDAAQGIGKSVKRGASDVGEAFEDANSSGQSLIEQETGFKGKSSY
jgi:hypothetical protein